MRAQRVTTMTEPTAAFNTPPTGPYRLGDYQSTSPVPDIRGIPRGVESVSFMQRHRFLSLIAAFGVAITMIVISLVALL